MSNFISRYLDVLTYGTVWLLKVSGMHSIHLRVLILMKLILMDFYLLSLRRQFCQMLILINGFLCRLFINTTHCQYYTALPLGNLATVLFLKTQGNHSYTISIKLAQVRSLRNSSLDSFSPE